MPVLSVNRFALAINGTVHLFRLPPATFSVSHPFVRRQVESLCDVLLEYSAKST